MRYLVLFFLAFFPLLLPAQEAGILKQQTDSLILVPADPAKGFHHNYLLFVPKGTPLQKQTVLLVEPNNTGKITDSMEVHEKHARDLASVSSVGNNISTELHIPLLVPVFPRPASQPMMYTHALDRDILLENTPDLKRLDLQLLAMIKDARAVLASRNIPVEDKFFMNGFSASGTFTNRFSFLHPDKIKSLAIGGFNGELMFPVKEINKIPLNYPVGINDFSELAGHEFDMAAYRQIPQFIYMGKLDDNDAVQFDDAYNEEERRIINTHIGNNVQDRYLNCQQVYRKHNINASFQTYEKVGHWTTSEVNLAVILFFLDQLRGKSKMPS